MTQRLEKIFGFEAKIDDDLTPAEEGLLRSVAIDLARIYEIDTKKFFVYFHHLRLLPKEFNPGSTKRRTTGRARSTKSSREGDISEKIRWLSLQFDVNKKQAEQGSIKFFNSLVAGDNLEEHAGKNIKPAYGDYEVSFLIPGSYFATSHYFKSAIITFIDTDKVKWKKRKIKATVLVVPTPEYAALIKDVKNRMPNTKIDVRFNKEIQLRLPFDVADASTERKLSNERLEGLAAKKQKDSLLLELAQLIKIVSFESPPFFLEDIEILRRAISCDEEVGAVMILRDISDRSIQLAKKNGLNKIVELPKRLSKDTSGRYSSEI